MRIISIILIVLLAVNPICIVFAQDTNEILSIKIKCGGITFPVDQNDKAWELYKKWEAYIGTIPISEVRFFEITGYKNYIKIAKAYKTKNDRFLSIDLCAVICGGILYYVGWNREKEVDVGDGIKFKVSDPSWQMMLGGSVLASVGLTEYIRSSEQSFENWATYGLVSKLANEYNAKLGQ